jgi:hypothetical protein
MTASLFGVTVLCSPTYQKDMGMFIVQVGSTMANLLLLYVLICDRMLALETIGLNWNEH